MQEEAPSGISGAIKISVGVTRFKNGSVCSYCQAITHITPLTGGRLHTAEMTITNNPSLVGYSQDNFLRIGLHEVGHLHGLDDSNGTTVMRQAQINNRLNYVTTCDRDAAFAQQQNNWSSGGGGGGVPPCPPGGCNPPGSFSCAENYVWDRSSGYCQHWENLLSSDDGGAASNIAPLITITWPLNGSYYASPVTGPVTVDTLDPDGQVWRVDWLINGQTAYVSHEYPFTYNAYNVGPGTYVVQAVAYDNDNVYTISAPITVYVY